MSDITVLAVVKKTYYVGLTIVANGQWQCYIRAVSFHQYCIYLGIIGTTCAVVEKFLSFSKVSKESVIHLDKITAPLWFTQVNLGLY